MRRAKPDAEQRWVGAVNGDSATVKVGSIVNYVGQHLLVLVDILLVFYLMFDLPAELLEDRVKNIAAAAAAAVHARPTTIACDTTSECSGGWSSSMSAGLIDTPLHLVGGPALCLPLAVIEMLLVIGGVEVNPGPVTPEQYTARLAEILVEAPTDDIKKILSGWSADKPRNTFLEELKKLKVPGLKTTLAWLLNVPVTNDEVKKLKQDQLTSSVTTVLESLLPDECDQCQAVSYTHLTLPTKA